MVPSGKTLRQALPPWEWLLEARAWEVWLFRFGFCFVLFFFCCCHEFIFLVKDVNYGI